MSTAPAIDSAFVAQLAAQVASMQQQIHALQAQVAELQAERQPGENGNGHPKAPPPPAAAPMAAARGPSSQLRERSGSTNRFFERTPTQVAEEEPPPPPPPPMPPFARVESTEVSPDKAKSSSVLSSGKLPASRRMHLPQTTECERCHPTTPRPRARPNSPCPPDALRALSSLEQRQVVALPQRARLGLAATDAAVGGGRSAEPGRGGGGASGFASAV